MLKNPIFNKAKKNSYKKTRSILTDESIENSSYNFVALVGYVILGLILFDYIHLLVPPKFLNPNWEIEVIGRIIESIWILLLGFMLVFFRTKERSIKLGELRVLSLLSWLALFVAIACFLAAPLLLTNAIRINQKNKTEISVQLTNQSTQLEQIFSRIDKASDREINTLLQSPQFRGSSIQDPQEGRQKLTDTIQQRQEAASKQLQKGLKAKQVQLFKSAFKWAIGAIISGIAFVIVWKYTSWTREIKM